MIVRKNNWWAATLQAALWKRFKGWERDDTEKPHVAEVNKESCLRATFYKRKYPALAPLNDESVHHFTRGEASEYILTQMAKLGQKPDEPIEKLGVIARPDFYTEKAGIEKVLEVPLEDGSSITIALESDSLIVELKDTVTGERMDFDNFVFRSYLRQLSYYMVMAGSERGFISIRYNVKELQWAFRRKGFDYFKRPTIDPINVGVESWEIILPKDDPVRRALEEEIEYRGNLLLTAIKTNNVSILPRVPQKKFNFKCKGCPFKDRCYNDDGETAEAAEYREATDLFDEKGKVIIGKPISNYINIEGKVKQV